jgi:L-seryl-tRNA(Ser) seleniumtransferase
LQASITTVRDAATVLATNDALVPGARHSAAHRFSIAIIGTGQVPLRLGPSLLPRACYWSFRLTQAMLTPVKRSGPKLRDIPAVEKVLQALGETGLPRPLTVALVRRELAVLRSQDVVPALASILDKLRAALASVRRSRLQTVINGTGILIHTNLGRAPLAGPVLETLQAVGASYSTLELDLDSGERGGRAKYLERNLALLCGAETATVTNNCAAALILVLRHFTRGERNEVIISRGEMIQIGGGFRIPEILEASGAVLCEVGTTNKTSVSDYAKAIRKSTALMLKVHRSNFFMGGFTESPSTEELAALARRQRIPLVEDLGSGAMIATERLAAIEHEPTPAEVLKRGVDLVCFSGDKLLGGPQAGVIAGKAKYVAALKREPFFRALRCDKLILSALQTTVDLYLSGQAEQSIPVLAMLRTSMKELRARAEVIAGALAGLPVQWQMGHGKGQLGGGTLPRSVIPSVTIDLQPETVSLAEFAAKLRVGAPPVIGCVSGGVFKLDLRTVFPAQDGELALALKAALAPAGAS